MLGFDCLLGSTAGVSDSQARAHVTSEWLRKNDSSIVGCNGCHPAVVYMFAAGACLPSQR